MDKKSLELAKRQGLNWRALLLEEAQTRIKLAIRDAVLKNKNFFVLDREIQSIINETTKLIDLEELRNISILSLNVFADKCFKQFRFDLGFGIVELKASIELLRNGELANRENVSKAINKVIGKDLEPYRTYYEIGLANQEYQKLYINKVRVALDNLRQIEAVSSSAPNISLRNVAEMEVRQATQQDKIKDLKDSGENLVIASVHGNCSKRCEPYQGGYYTLDNTYQIVDGIEFKPLKDATDVFVTTKAGRVYKNGLLGFNCRHYLIPYRKGTEPPEVNAKIIEAERYIDQKMRYYERGVRAWKEEAILNKGVDIKKYQIAKKKAQEWNAKYIEFAQVNERAYYPDRTKLI